MITFTICLLALIAGYFIYGRLVERVFGPDDRKTPALTHADGVDYIPLPTRIIRTTVKPRITCLVVIPFLPGKSS